MKLATILLSISLFAPTIVQAGTKYWIKSVTIPEGNSCRLVNYDSNSAPDLCVMVEEDGMVLEQWRKWNTDHHLTENKEGWSAVFKKAFQNLRTLDLSPKKKKVFSFVVFDHDSTDSNDLIIRIDDIDAKFIADQGDKVVIYQKSENEFTDKSTLVKIVLQKVK